LKKHSITPYNGAIVNYLGRFIEEETGKVDKVHASRKRLNELKQYRKEYEQQIAVLTKDMESSRNEELLDEDSIDQLVKHLYRLRHWGEFATDQNGFLKLLS
jgi:hypothetical protein